MTQFITQALTLLIFVATSTLSYAHGDEHEHEMSPVGMPAAESKAMKVIKVTADDTMRYKFEPTPDLEDGDVVKFVVTNNGKLSHEFSIGDDKEQSEHRAMMRRMPNMVHKDGNTITVAPGATESLTWQFKSGTEVVFACNIPGHYEAGMFLNAKVTKKEHDEHMNKMEEHEHEEHEHEKGHEH